MPGKFNIIGFYARRGAACAVIGGLVAMSCLNQWRGNLVYLAGDGREIFLARLQMTDAERHMQSAGGGVLEVADRIGELPPGSVLFFVPVFPEVPGPRANTIHMPGAGDGTLWWWHMYHVLRYFSYPTKIITIDEKWCDDKSAFERKYIQGKERFSDLEWIRRGGVTHVIFYRDNKVSVAPVSALIDLGSSKEALT
ncbi:MAG: hypothetical protein ABIH74_00325 [Candidatus Omnitrophota bacterium]